VFEHLPGDHRGCGLDHGEPVVGVAFPAGGDAPPVAQPAVGAFDRPAVAGVGVARAGPQPVGAADRRGAVGDGIAGAAAAADHGLDAALTELLAELVRVVAAVGPQLARDDPARSKLINKRQQLPPLVLVAGADPDRKRRPAGLDDQVETAARAAAERAADLAAPFFVSTSEASAIARDQSTNPSRSNSSCSRTSSRSQTPARRHS